MMPKRVSQKVLSRIRIWLLGLFYFVVFVPLVILARLLGDPLRLRTTGQTSFWAIKQATEASLQGAKRQF
jgi:hypothetical protein